MPPTCAPQHSSSDQRHDLRLAMPCRRAWGRHFAALIFYARAHFRHGSPPRRRGASLLSRRCARSRCHCWRLKCWAGPPRLQWPLARPLSRDYEIDITFLSAYFALRWEYAKYQLPPRHANMATPWHDAMMEGVFAEQKGARPAMRRCAVEPAICYSGMMADADVKKAFPYLMLRCTISYFVIADA